MRLLYESYNVIVTLIHKNTIITHEMKFIQNYCVLTVKQIYMGFINELMLIGFDIASKKDNEVIAVWFDDSRVFTVSVETKNTDFDISITKIIGDNVEEINLHGTFEDFFDAYLKFKRFSHRRTDNAICTKQGIAL